MSHQKKLTDLNELCLGPYVLFLFTIVVHNRDYNFEHRLRAADALLRRSDAPHLSVQLAARVRAHPASVDATIHRLSSAVHNGLLLRRDHECALLA